MSRHYIKKIHVSSKSEMYNVNVKSLLILFVTKKAKYLNGLCKEIRIEACQNIDIIP